MIDLREVRIPVHGEVLDGTLAVPRSARGVVLFAHGSGSSRFSPRNRAVSRALAEAGFATLLIDLLTGEEAALDARTARLRFDVDLLAERLVDVTEWLASAPETRDLHVGYFGASTGAAAALVAAARLPNVVSAVVSRGGRPDLAGAALEQVVAPTLLIVGGDDGPVLDLNRWALALLGRHTPASALRIIPGAGHLFEEPGALGHVVDLARSWFAEHLGRAAGRPLDAPPPPY